MHSSRRILSNPWNPRTFKDCDQQGEVPLHEEGGEVLGVLRGEDVQDDHGPPGRGYTVHEDGQPCCGDGEC